MRIALNLLGLFFCACALGFVFIATVALSMGSWQWVCSAVGAVSMLSSAWSVAECLYGKRIG